MGRSKTKTGFRLEGQFLSVKRSDNGKPKGIQLTTSDGTESVKLSKSLRREFPVLNVGDRIAIVGREKRNAKTGKIERKAKQILTVTVTPSVSPTAIAPSSTERPTGKILVCQKSKCRKRGGQDIYRTLERTLEEHGLADSVQVCATGCLKRCKAAPNAVVLPDKARYGKLSPEDVPACVRKHFAIAS
ncbi:(2Fe-2S) ferredoxin domain-containing protein [Baaleninema simplex]|uniref:(2Fe-2S) ferredoxin domain-containing protein n=1 Tax=Baaleninema simplex TaxID=2862350 RepID=UPI000348E15E|nr:(2Fe-2S) ferredoxin domain-containing protein [Baaleninema simplex]